MIDKITDKTKPNCTHPKQVSINNKINICQICSTILIIDEYNNTSNLNVTITKLIFIQIEILKSYSQCYNLNENILEVFRHMNEHNYSPINNIDYKKLDIYIDTRDDIKKCLWKVINKFQFYANTFYMALYFMDTIFVNKYDFIKLSNFDVLCIGCIILASMINIPFYK